MKTIALALALCASLPAIAQDNSLWLNVGAVSKHFDESRGYNENNQGLGLEYRLSQNTSILGGVYYNSLRHNTSYLSVNYQPFHYGGWKLGAAIGFMDGYPALANGGAFFAAIPMLSYEGSRFGVNLGAIPTTPQVQGMVMAQLKIRIN